MRGWRQRTRAALAQVRGVRTRSDREPSPADSQALLSARSADAARALLGLFVLSLIFSVLIGGVLNAVFPVSPGEAHRLISALGPLGPLGLTLIIALLIVFVPMPTIPFDIAAGIGYGAAAGTACVLAGHVIGALAAFVLARRYGRASLRRLLPARAMSTVERLSSQLGFRLLILLRLLPLFDFKVVSYASGLTEMPPIEYAAGTLTGIALPVFAMVSVGAELVTHPLRAALILGGFGMAAGATAAYLLFGRSLTRVREPLS